VTSECIFCAIVSDEAPRSVVAEDELTITFMDILPVTPGHLLVVPKVHATHLADLPEETGAQMMATAMQCAAALRTSPLRTDGINLFLADGAAAGQEVFHVHLHVLPRFLGDGFALALRYEPAPPRPTLDEHAALLAAIMAG
jgi:histidine triad (HIT) family protein